MKKVVKEYIEKKKTVRSNKLKNQLDASNLISKYIELYEADKIEKTKFRNLCYGVRIYSEILKNRWLDESEKRLDELEKNGMRNIEIRMIDSNGNIYEG